MVVRRGLRTTRALQQAGLQVVVALLTTVHAPGTLVGSAAAATATVTIPHLRYLTYYTVGPMNLTDWWGEPYTLPGPTGAEPGVNLAIGFGESSPAHPHRGRIGLASFPNIEKVASPAHPD